METDARTKRGRSRGFSLAEMVIYVTLLTIVFLLVANTVLVLSRSYRQLRALRSVEHAAITSLERMTRDIRASADVNAVQSVLGTHPGTLSLASAGTTTRFYLDNGVLKMDVNGAYEGPLTPSNASVTSLVFRTTATPKSKAVKIDMTMSATVGSVTRTKNYHTTIILRGI